MSRVAEFTAGEKVHMQTDLRYIRGFIEHVGDGCIRIRWEDDTIGLLQFEWQLARLEHGWPE